MSMGLDLSSRSGYAWPMWGRDDWKVTPGRFSDQPPQGVTLQVGALAQVWGKISCAYARMCVQVGLYVGRMYPPRVFTPPPAGAPAGGKIPLAACQLPFYPQLPSYSQLCTVYCRFTHEAGLQLPFYSQLCVPLLASGYNSLPRACPILPRPAGRRLSNRPGPSYKLTKVMAARQEELGFAEKLDAWAAAPISESWNRMGRARPLALCGWT